MTSTKRQSSLLGLSFASPIPPLLLLSDLPATAQPEDYTYANRNGTITITRYRGPGGAVTIPDNINGLPVTSIEYHAFSSRPSLTSVMIPNGVTNIGSDTFLPCTHLANIGIPRSVASIGRSAFAPCTSLTGVYFQGNRPSAAGTDVCSAESQATVYYLKGTTGRGTTFGGRPTALWKP